VANWSDSHDDKGFLLSYETLASWQELVKDVILIVALLASYVVYLCLQGGTW
jgi:hypothetical protein